MQKTAEKILKKHIVDIEESEVKRTLGPDLPTTEYLQHQKKQSINEIANDLDD